MITEKIWGTTEALIRTPMFELHRLFVKPMHRCSLHLHQFKHNAFYIISGQLFIDSIVSDLSSAPVENICLYARDTFTVAPGVHHQFRTGDFECTALEMYFTEPLSEDIIRRNVGGPSNWSK